MTRPESLATTARSALVWSGGSTLLRDAVQLATMLVLVRLLDPTDYGTAALAQSITGFVLILSASPLVLHALQLRNPDDVDWQAHFTASVVINGAVAILILAIAAGLSQTELYRSVALPVAALAALPVLDSAATVRHRMLETRHDWARFRLVIVLGTVLGAVVGIAVAFLGGGVWALIVQPLLFGLPAAIDLLFISKWRPDWSWSWTRYREAAKFGLNRMGSHAVVRGRPLVEQSVLAGVYDFAILGYFTRSVGLATLLVGRVGTVALAALYPVITRTRKESEAFRRVAALCLQGVVWTTIPAILFLVITAEETVLFLYGPRWTNVIPLLPFAAAAVGLSGVTTAISQLLLANERPHLCLYIDVVMATSGMVLAFVLIPIGLKPYLAAVALQAMLIGAISLLALNHTKGINPSGVAAVTLPAIVAGGAATAGLIALRIYLPSDMPVSIRLVISGLAFGGLYAITLRLFFARQLGAILAVAPGGDFLRKRIFHFQTGSAFANPTSP